MTARPRFLTLEVQAVWRAFSRAWAKTGNRIAARIAIMAMTTSSSISVNPRRESRSLRGFGRYLTVVPPMGGCIVEQSAPLPEKIRLSHLLALGAVEAR